MNRYAHLIYEFEEIINKYKLLPRALYVESAIYYKMREWETDERNR